MQNFQSRSVSKNRLWLAVLRNKWFLLVIAVLAGSFYWFQLRPIQLARDCATGASSDARMLLAGKADVTKGTPAGDDYQKLIDKNLYLRSDYESFLSKCLLHYNISRPLLPAPVAATKSSASTSSSAK